MDQSSQQQNRSPLTSPLLASPVSSPAPYTPLSPEPQKSPLSSPRAPDESPPQKRRSWKVIPGRSHVRDLFQASSTPTSSYSTRLETDGQLHNKDASHRTALHDVSFLSEESAQDKRLSDEEAGQNKEHSSGDSFLEKSSSDSDYDISSDSSDNRSCRSVCSIDEVSDREDCLNYHSSSESNHSDFYEDDDNINKCKLYHGCDKSVDEAVLDLMENYQKNHETHKSLQDHLKTFVKYLPNPNHMPKTLYRLFKYVENQAPFPHFPYLYCGECLLLVHDNKTPCEACGSSVQKVFYGFRLEDQIKYYFECCNLASTLDEYQNQNLLSDDELRDVCDGSEYKKLPRNGKYDLTLLWATDGVSISHSSKNKLYPLQCVICEVPPHLRFSFVIISAVWCDMSEPPMSTLLRPFVDSLRTVQDKGGVSWSHPTSKAVHTSSVCAPVASVDAPVRADLLNTLRHNSKYACNTCEQKTVRIPHTPEDLIAIARGKKLRRRRAFLFKEDPARLRNDDRLKKQGTKAFEEGKVIKGVKGPSVAQLIPGLDLSTFLIPEYMHCVCLGVVDDFLTLWTSVPGPWNISKHIEDIDKIMEAIRPPDSIGRLPRKVSDASHWKASELRAWFLFYSVIVLEKYLPSQYLQHWFLFVMAIFLLLKAEVSSTDISLAETFLRLFVRDIGTLYRDKDYVYNVHNLVHLPLHVERWGPLWATSAFGFENFYGTLVNLIHGTKNPALELVKKIKVASGIQILRNRVVAMAFNIQTTSTRVNIELLSKRDSFSMTEAGQLLCEHGFSENITVFARANIKKQTFTSLAYSTEKKRNNYTIQFQASDRSAGYGELSFFFVSPDGEAYAVVRYLKVNQSKILFHVASRAKLSHIMPVLPTTELLLINVKNIQEKVIRVSDFVCHHPNYYERNL